MRRDFQPAYPADAHAFHSVEQAADERASLDPDFGDERHAVVVQSRDAHRAPCSRPADRLSLVQPQTKADLITVLAAHRLTGSWKVCEESQARSQALAEGLAFPCEQGRDVRQ